MAEDSKVCDIICDRPHVLVIDIKEGEITRLVAKNQRKYDNEDHKRIEKTFKSKKLLIMD